MRADFDAFRKANAQQNVSVQKPSTQEQGSQANKTKRKAPPPQDESDSMDTESSHEILENIQKSMKQIMESISMLNLRMGVVETKLAIVGTPNATNQGSVRTMSGTDGSSAPRELLM